MTHVSRSDRNSVKESVNLGYEIVDQNTTCGSRYRTKKAKDIWRSSILNPSGLWEPKKKQFSSPANLGEPYFEGLKGSKNGRNKGSEKNEKLRLPMAGCPFSRGLHTFFPTVRNGGGKTPSTVEATYPL